MADRAAFDQNNRTTIMGTSNDGLRQPVTVWADPSSHALRVGDTPVPVASVTTAAAVAIIDASGNQITSFGGGTQYTDGGTPPANPVGPTLEFNNAGTWAAVGTAHPLPIGLFGAAGGQVTVTGGKLDVNATISGAGGGTSAIDNTAFTAGSDTGTPAMGFYKSTISTVTDGDVAVIGMTPKRGMFVNLQTAAGVETGVAAAPLQVSLANTGANTSKLLVTADPITFASAQSVNATLSAETTKVIGVTRTADGAGNLLTSTGNALDLNLKTSSITLPVSIAGTVTIAGAVTEATLDAALISQEATTLGVKGLTMFGAVTTNAPTYTTAKSDALSLDTAGLLRVSLKDTPANTNNLNVNLAASAATVTVSGTVTTTPPSNASTNIAQINGVTPLMGNGGTGTGSLRVTIASDNTAFAVNATLSAETTKVIGVVRNSDGAGNLLTSNSTTYTAKFAQDANLLGTLGTAFSTAGKVDVKGADGDVFVRQATGTNLHTVIDSGTVSTITNVVHVDDNSGSLTVDSAALTTADLDTGAGTDTRGVMGVALGKSGGALILASGQQTMANSLPITVASDQTSFPVTIAAGSAVIGHVIVDSGAITATLSAETTKVIGTVNIAASQTIAVTNAGTFATQSTLAAETTKVIGTVRTADGAGNLYTTNSTTYTAKFAQDGNLLGTLGTAFSTAGKVDVKGADGDVFVRQATAANLNATVVGTGTFAVQADNTKIAGNAILAGNGASGTGAQRVTIASDSTGQIAPAANATATGTAIYNNTALSATKQAVNASAGNLYGYHIYNPNSVVIYVQLWNIASASVTVGTTAPTAVLAVPAGGWADAPPSGPPIAFATALTIAATTTATGLTAPTTALLCNMWYK